MNKRMRRGLGGVALGLLLGLGVPGVGHTEPVPNLTGTWEGKYSCKILVNGEWDNFIFPSILKITHTDTALNAEIDGDYHYAGFAGAEENNPAKGAATFVECRTTPTASNYNEIISVRVNTQPAKAVMKGESAFSTGTAVGGTCTYTYRRIDLADPGIGPCPQ